MNSHFLRTFSLLGITSAIVGFSGFSAQAQEAQSGAVRQNISNKAADLQNSSQTSIFAQQAPLPTQQQDPLTPAPTLTPQPTQPPTPTQEQYQPPIQTPVPAEEPVQTPAPTVQPGRATRGGPSYIGVGGNIGITGETTLSEGSFAVISKLGLTNNLSVRPAALISEDAVFLIPVTLDFPIESITQTGETQISAAPYLGAGVSISTADDSNVGFLVSGGVDVPIADRLTANAGLNVSFLDDTNIGVLLGVGYNF
ncbi:MAG: hypothetical protein HXY43_00700 [Fischerella sp.]|jgi:hypothetical protein|uniref:outer membrane protein n=1 Tax=Fischerella sp. TaxID=1191 RepID=UPI0017FD82C9|nr:hypothetical protein [Fischerella sp.]NWF57867.1 hypothetical protein [Fischerella sp.]